MSDVIFQRGGATQQQVVVMPPTSAEQRNGTLPALSATFTADNSSNTFTSSSHGFGNGDVLQVENSGGALPSGLDAETDYYVKDKTDNTFKLSVENGGSELAITDDGTGTQTWNHQAREITFAKTSEAVLLINTHASNALEVILKDSDDNWNEVGMPLPSQYDLANMSIRVSSIRVKQALANTTYHYTCYQE